MPRTMMMSMYITSFIQHQKKEKRAEYKETKQRKGIKKYKKIHSFIPCRLSISLFSLFFLCLNATTTTHTNNKERRRLKLCEGGLGWIEYDDLFGVSEEEKEQKIKQKMKVFFSSKYFFFYQIPTFFVYTCMLYMCHFFLKTTIYSPLFLL